MLSDKQIDQFRALLLAWFRRHKRDLPWRRTKDPYAIWISEIMLQQTRVAAVIPFYERFLLRFPHIAALAEAPESDLLAHWAGLGYYYRARNLQRAALQMCLAGRFADSYEAIRVLPGVGDYTAAAVASIAFGLPHAAVDGNVLRVLSRVLADSTDIATAKGKKHFAAMAFGMLPCETPGDFNQAMMELGATVCLPKNPQCLVCPVAGICQARETGRQAEFPTKSARDKSVAEERTLFWVEEVGQVLAWQRPSDSRLMPGFWELPERSQLPGALAGIELGSFRHGITFHNYRFTVCEAEAPDNLGECSWLSLDALPILPVSTTLHKAQQLVLRTRNQKQAAASV